MLCPDCNDEMTEEQDYDDAANVVEMIYICPACGTEFFGTLYRNSMD